MCEPMAIRMMQSIEDMLQDTMAPCWNLMAWLRMALAGTIRPMLARIGPAGPGRMGSEPDSAGRRSSVGALGSDRDLLRHSMPRGGAHSGGARPLRHLMPSLPPGSGWASPRWG